MSLDEEKWLKQIDKYPEAMECTTQSNSMRDSYKNYKYLEGLRDSIPKELYAYNLRRLLQGNTGGVSKELRLSMLEGVSREDIMYKDELEAIENFDEYIMAYRGTDKTEDVPGISWSIAKHVAETDFYRGRLFEGKISKDDILVYIMHDAAEEEIIVKEVREYEIIKED